MKTTRRGEYSMMLRVVLVGMVAALGVSIPSRPSCEHWYDSAQAWATSLLAEWDTWTAVENVEPRLPGSTNHLDCEECRVARMRLVAKANENRKEEIVAADAKVTLEPSQPVDLEELEILGPYCRGAIEPAAEAAVAEAPLPEQSNLPILQEAFISGFGAIDPASLYAAKLCSSEPEPEPSEIAGAGDPNDASSFAEISCLDEAIEWDEELDVMAGQPEVSPFLADLPADVFVPEQVPTLAAAPAAVSPEPPAKVSQVSIVTTTNLAAVSVGMPSNAVGVSIAMAANLTAEPVAKPESVAVSALADPGAPVAEAVMDELPSDVFVPLSPTLFRQETAAKDRPAEGARTQPARLGDAVQLTRQAVSAWVSVLIGPAVVHEGARR